MYIFDSKGFHRADPYPIEAGKVYYKGSTVPASIVYVTRVIGDRVYYLYLEDNLYMHSTDNPTEKTDSLPYFAADVGSAMATMKEEFNKLLDEPYFPNTLKIQRVLKGDPSGFDIPAQYETFEQAGVRMRAESAQRIEEEKRTKHYSCAETAVLVRTALKTAFPGVKFSVRSNTYSGGASIDIHWTDGPITARVDEVVSPFEGATFDGMQDLKEYHKSIDPEGNLCRYGADFIFCSRRYSESFLRRVIAEETPKWGKTPADVTLITDRGSEPYIEDMGEMIDPNDPYHKTLRDKIIQAAHNTEYTASVPDPVADSPEPVTDSTPLISTYKGHPTITLDVNGKSFAFGLEKAKAILRDIDAIQSFVESN